MSKHKSQDPGVSRENIKIAAKQYRAAMNRTDYDGMTAAAQELWNEELGRRPYITDALFDTFADEAVRDAVLTGMRRGFCLGMGYGMQVYQQILIQAAEEDQ